MRARNPADRPWSVPVALDDVPETGRRIELSPDDATRAAIAKLAGVSGLSRLQAGFDLTRQGRNALRVVGSVSATVDQTCVVTLEPLRNEVDEAIDLVFTPGSGAGPDDKNADSVAVDAADPPEQLADGVVDLGAVATEFLLLGIDPYPRKPDAVFDPPPAKDAESHPFAGLAALKKGGEQGDR